MLSSAGHRLLSLIVLCVLIPAPVTGQWSRPTFDAAIAYLGNNSQSMIELLDMNGTGGVDALAVRIGIGSPSSFVSMKVLDFNIGWILSNFMTVPSVGTMDPASGIGRFGPDDGRDDAVLGVGQTVWVLSAPAGATPGPVLTLTVNGAVTGARIGDFDGDGNGDVAVLTDTELTLHLWSGPGATTPITMPLPAGSGSLLVAGEFTGDGASDVAVIGNQVDLYTLAAGAISPAGSHLIGLSDPMPDAGDIDQDGDVDLIVFGTTHYVVLRRTGPASFSIEAPFLGGPATRLVDVDGDGDLDGACCGGGSGPPAILYAATTFHISINDQGVFLPAYTLHGIGGWHLAGVADVDGDGLRDLVAGRAVYLARQSLGLDPWRPGPSAPVSPQNVGDLDGDGDPDWGIGPSATHWNDGIGDATISALPLIDPPPAGTSYGGPAITGDFDGDGDLDLVVDVLSAGVATDTRLLLGRGGAFADGGPAIPPGFALSPWTGPDAERILVVDANGDGYDDFVARSPGPTYWSHLWLSTGGGPFTFGQSFDGEVVVAMADLTGDAIIDALVSDGRLRLRRGTASGTFAPAEPLTSMSYALFNGWGTFDPFQDSVAIGDFDADGDPDLVAAERTSSGGAFPAVLENEGGAVPPFTFSNSPGGLAGINGALPARLLSGDLDRDGIADVVVSNPFNAGWNGAGIAFGSGNSFMFDGSRSEQILTPIHALADIDGDGDLDAIGPDLVLNRTFEGATVGSRHQWGSGTAGTGGVTPLLGATAPIRAGEPFEIRIAGAAGLGTGLLALGTQPNSAPLVGGTLYLVPEATLPFLCTGTPGLTGDGRWTLPLAPLPSSLAGFTIHLQAGLVDPAAAGSIALTDALTLIVGQ